MRLLLLFLLVLTACSPRLPRQGNDAFYRHVSGLQEDKLPKELSRSRVTLEVNFETGDFTGKYRKHDFTGKFSIDHVSAGFVKGFFYRVHLEKLTRLPSGNAEEEAFFEHLSAASRLYLAPDRLPAPTYTFLEIRKPGNESPLIFVKMFRDRPE